MKYSEEANRIWPYLLPLVQKVARASGGSSTGTGVAGSGVPNPHGLSSIYHTGTLADVQAPQFLKLDGSRSLSGHLSVNTGITIDGVDISAFKSAYDIHVADPDAHHARATAGNGISVTGQQVAVNQGFSFSWTGTHSFDHDIQLDADLDFIGAQQITTSAGHLTLNPFADLVLPSTKTDRSSDYADGIPIQGYSFHINSGGWRQLTTHTIKADELHVRVFIADTVRVDVGEEYWGKSMGIVYADFTTPASIGGTVTAIFEDSVALTGAVFADNDWIMISTVEIGTGLEVNQIWGQVSGYTNLGADANGVGRQSWTFTLRNGPTNLLIKKGRLAVDFGASGQGYVHLSTLDSADGPWIQIGTWAGANPYTSGNRTIRTQIGNLSPISDPVLSPTGFGLYSENAYLQGIVSAASDVVRLDSDGVRIKGEPSALDALYAYEFRNNSDVELGGLYLKYTSLGGSDRLASVYTRSIGTNHIRPFTSMVAESIGSGPGGGDATVFMQAANLTNSKAANITLDADNTTGTIIFGASDYAQFNSDLRTQLARPQVDVTYDLGTASLRYRTLYVNTIVASGGISGGTIGGAEWEYAGSMVIDANSASNTVVSVANQGAGSADLDVDRNITLGGTVDGVDISAHAANPSAHHALASAGDGIGVSGQVISVDGTVVRTPATVVRTSVTIATSGALAGGGDLSANRTLSLTLGTNSGLNQTSGLVVDSSIAGGGLTLTAGVLAVGAGSAITVNANDIAVNLGANSGLNVTSGLVVDSSIAGAGLTMTTGVLNVIALSTGGLTANANDLQIKLPAASGLTTDATGLFIADAIAGAGLVIASKVLAVGAGTGITVAADSIAVDQAFTPTWSGAHIFSSGVTLNGAVTLNNDLSITGLRTISSNSTNNLTIAPGGDLVLSPAGLNVLPTGSYAVDLGDYNRKWRTLYVAELYAETLVAQSVMATIGGRIMVTPSTTLVADLGSAVGDTTIHLKHNAYVSGTYIMLETAPGGVPQFEVMKITSSASGSAGDYTYTVTRNLDGTGRNAWLNGDSVVAFAGAAAGDGFIDLTSTTTSLSHAGPTITVYARTAATNWNDVKPVVTMGNLDSFLSYGTEYGFAVGNDLTLSPSTGFSGFSADRTNGVRLYNTNIQLYASGSMAATLNPSAGLAFKAQAFGTSSIGWWDHVDVPGDFTDVYRYASIYHVLNGSNSILALSSQGQGATYTEGAIYLTAVKPSPFGQMSLWMDRTQIAIGTGSSYGSSNVARFDANGFGIHPNGAIGVPLEVRGTFSKATGGTVAIFSSSEASSGANYMYFGLDPSAGGGSIGVIEPGVDWHPLRLNNVDATNAYVTIGPVASLGHQPGTSKLRIYGPDASSSVGDAHILHFNRDLTNGISYNQDMIISMGRYVAGVNSNTQVTFSLNNAAGEAPSPVLILRGDLTVGAGGINPSGNSYLAVRAGVSTDTAEVGGTIYEAHTATNNSGTGATNLLGFTLPSWTFGFDGNSVWIDAYGTVTNSANAKTIRVDYAGNTLCTLTLAAGTARTWTIRGRMIRTGSPGAKWIFVCTSDGAVQTSAGANSGFGHSTANTLWVTGQGGASNEITCESVIYRWYPGNT